VGGSLSQDKERARLYKPSAKQMELVAAPRMTFLMVDGTGGPDTSQEHKDAVEVLYALSYGLEVARKKALGAGLDEVFQYPEEDPS
jgi:hypothetical protein